MIRRFFFSSKWMRGWKNHASHSKVNNSKKKNYLFKIFSQGSCIERKVNWTACQFVVIIALQSSVLYDLGTVQRYTMRCIYIVLLSMIFYTFFAWAANYHIQVPVQRLLGKIQPWRKIEINNDCKPISKHTRYWAQNFNIGLVHYLCKTFCWHFN